MRRGVVACALSLLGCQAAVEPPEYSTVASVVEASCAQCHDSGGFGALLTAVAALPPEGFDGTRFPPSDFPVHVRAFTTEDLTEEPHIEAGMPTEQAWILHELNMLDDLLAEEVPPDFTSEASLDAFALYTGGGYTEGCELLEKLDLGRDRDPEGMPPAWAASLMSLLARESFAEPSAADRDALRAYTVGVLGPEVECAPEP